MNSRQESEVKAAVTQEELTHQEIKSLRRRLREAEDTLYAIQAGEVDAVVVNGVAGQQIYTLESPDQPFRIFVEQMQEGALTINGDRIIIYCNPFFAALVGRHPRQVRGQSIDQFIASDLQTFRNLIESASDSVIHGEGWLHGANETAIPVQLALNPLPPENQRLIGLVVTDLSEREHAKKLDAERRAAEDAKAARDQFLAVVSHELRTPLNAVLGWTQQLRRREDLPNSVKRGLEVIESSAWNQAQLIDDLLDVTRILTGKLILELSTVELTYVVEGSIAVLQPSADAKNINIQFIAPKEKVVLRADLDRLHQIINNLISNAIKFTPEDGVISVRVQQAEQFATIEVVDSGIGIASEFLPMLFELYQQRKHSSNRSGGLGLGLAIVKELTELHGGEVSASSDGEGSGSTFTIRLPIADGVAIEELSNPSQPARIVALGGVKILLVEDDKAAREVLTELLSEYNADVTSVASAEAALEVLEHKTLDVLISDINLPNMDGFELIREVRNRGFSGRDLPAIALTAFASREDRKQTLVAGFQLHLPKPVDLTELCAAIANLAGVV